jgi:hypothetical protein
MGPDDEVDPFFCQATVAALSDRLWTVCDLTSKAWAKTSNCAMVTASSRSLLVMVPRGLAVETSLAAIEAGHWGGGRSALLLDPFSKRLMRLGSKVLGPAPTRRWQSGGIRRRPLANENLPGRRGCGR